MKEPNQKKLNDNKTNQMETNIPSQEMDFELGLDQAIKKAKRRTLIRNIGWSGLVVIILFVAIIFGGEAIKQSQRTSMESTLLTLYEIAKPNQYLGQSTRFEGIANGQVNYTTYKWLDNTLVYTGENTYHYGFPQARWSGTFSPSIIGESFDDTAQYPSYNELGQREMIFYYPYVDYQKLPNDLELLAEIPEDKVMELALSFDKVYSLEEVQEFVPADAHISWYWLDDIGEEQKDTLMRDDDLGSMNRVRSEHTAFGVKTRNSHGEPIKEPFEWFMLILENSYNDRDRIAGKHPQAIWLKSNLENLYHRFLEDNPEKDINKLPIAGIVVTGDAESLQVWNNVKQVRAVSLGTTADKY